MEQLEKPDRSPSVAEMSDLETDLETLPVVDPVVDPTLDDPILDDGDHDRFSHYVRKDKILPSAIEGTPVRALCGKKWVPNRDPKKFPVCPECKDIYDKLKDPG
jgi:hypothetical protein